MARRHGWLGGMTGWEALMACPKSSWPRRQTSLLLVELDIEAKAFSRGAV